jgi:hypothetical protein
MPPPQGYARTPTCLRMLRHIKALQRLVWRYLPSVIGFALSKPLRFWTERIRNPAGKQGYNRLPEQTYIV